MNMLCLVGLHKWEYYNEVIPFGVWDFNEPCHEYRWCSRCGRLEFISTHWYGLNPPKYGFRYSKVDGKPHFGVRRGETVIKAVLPKND